MGSYPTSALECSGPVEPATLCLKRGLSPATPAAADAPPPFMPAGEYELLKLLGRGGMGMVYLARQSGSRRQVAYKVLTALGDGDPEALARFRGEAQTLARLRHPGIVAVYDSGTHLGSPFIAMEYVPGGSLRDLMRTGHTTAHQAAALLATVAAAVGYAHAQGVIHRDLKPANILLDADGQPKVADFGLARDLLGEQGGCRVTRTGIIAGTPGYMPPEQIEGKRKLTPAVDVWALGVMLYEMITGAVPFPGTDAEQVFARVLGHEPIPPCVWQATVPRDLETICLKCLHKEPRRRYGSGTELADDLRRFLNNRPILARRVGVLEKGVRWCRRNRAVAGLSAAILLTLTIAGAVSLALVGRIARDRSNALAAAEAEAVLRHQAETAMQAEQKARREAEATTAMLDSLLTSITPGQDILGNMRREMDRVAKALDANPGDPLVRARLLVTLGLTRQRMGDYAEAISFLEQALALRREHLGADAPLTLESACALGYAYIAANRGADAVRVLEPVLTARVAALPPDSPDAVEDLSLLRGAYDLAGRRDEADALAERVVALCAKHYGEDHEVTEWYRINLRRYSAHAGHLDEAIPVLRKALARFQATCESDSVQVICARAELGRCLLEAGKPQEALPYLKTMYETSVVRNGPTHPIALVDRNDLARCYEACGRFSDAVAHRRELHEHFRKAGDAEQADREAELLQQDLAAIR